MEITAVIISSITSIIVGLMSAIAYVKSNREEKKAKEKAKLDEIKKKLADQVIAFYCLEQEYLAVLSNEKEAPDKNVKVEMRNRAKKHEKNINQVYPDMQPNEVKVYL